MVNEAKDTHTDLVMFAAVNKLWKNEQNWRVQINGVVMEMQPVC